MSSLSKRLLPVVLLALSIALVSCAKPSTNQPETPKPVAPKPSAEETENLTQVSVYFARDEKLGPVARQVTDSDKIASLAGDAVEALMEGPTAEETEYGFVSTVPQGSEFIGLEVENGTATVNLNAAFQSGGGSLSMQMRAAQVIFTLTQFEEIERVAFEIEGKPIEALGGEGVQVGPTVDREDFEAMAPAILVESPLPGEGVTSPLKISGSSNTFEATHQINVTDPEGLIIAEKTVTATSGTGTRGTWSETVEFGPVQRPGLGSVICFEYSAKDGSRINLVEIPIQMR